MGLFSRKKKPFQKNAPNDAVALLQLFADAKAKHGEDEAKAQLMAAMLAQQVARCQKGCDIDEIPGGTGEFGLALTNPVPVCGIPSNEKYLGSLRTIHGERITWKRIGSFSAGNIANPIDGYAIASETGQDLGALYISPYHRRTSQKAPKGFRIVT